MAAALRGLVCLSLAWLAGCGGGAPPTYPVAGKVLFPDGSPVTHGIIEFNPENGPVARARIGPDGGFVLRTGDREGAVAGDHRIAIIQAASAEDVSPLKHRHAARFVPGRFRDPVASGLRRTIPSGGARDLVVRLPPGKQVEVR